MKQRKQQRVCTDQLFGLLINVVAELGMRFLASSFDEPIHFGRAAELPHQSAFGVHDPAEKRIRIRIVSDPPGQDEIEFWTYNG